MVKLGKWIGGGLGWAFGGPIGALLGFFLGSFIDAATTSIKTATMQPGQHTQRGDFILTVLVLSAAVMKADKVVKKSELDFVKKFLLTNFGEEQTRESLLILKDLLNKDIPLDDVCRQINYNMNNALKLQVIHYLYGIAASDGIIHKEEIEIIRQISLKIGLSEREHNSVKSMFIEETNSAYEILGVSRSATNDEIKKAYRSMAIKHHPDKVANLGTDIQEASKTKFQSINQAWEKVKKERGII